jgi:hypothetical protein
VDWITVTTARMKGWQTPNSSDRRFHHHRMMGSAGKGTMETMFFMGKERLHPWELTDLVCVSEWPIE